MKTKLRSRRRAAMKVHQESSIGPRCRSFFAGCITCASWHHFDKKGYFPRSFLAARAWGSGLEKAFGSGAEFTWMEVHGES